MELKVKQHGDVLQIGIVGRLDSTSAPEAEEQILQLASSASGLVLDMGECPYISSAGLRTLIVTVRNFSDQGKRAVLAQLNEQVTEVMEITSFMELFETYDSTEAALEALRGETP